MDKAVFVLKYKKIKRLSQNDNVQIGGRSC